MKRRNRRHRRRLYKRCRSCGRSLSSYKSMEIGMGIVCAKKSDGLIYMEKLERAGQLRLFD